MADQILTKDYIKALLARSDQAIARALLVLLDRQTDDEQDSQVAKYQNGRGFTSCDAAILTSFALQVQQGRTLSPKQLNLARRYLPKYSGQLLEAAQQKAARGE